MTDGNGTSNGNGAAPPTAPTPACEFPKIIELNVGGTYYSTTLDTLRSDPESMLCAMFSGRVGVLRDKDSRYFIDRDGPLFRYVLNYLRKGTCCLPRTEAERDELREEAEFYQLEGLIKLLNASQLGVTLGRKALTATKESSGGQKILNDVELALMPFIEEATEAGASSLEIQFGYNHTHAFMEALNKPFQGLKVTPDQSGYKKICDYMKDPVLSRLIMHHFQSRGFSVTYTVSFQSLWMRFDLWESASYQSESTRKIEQMLNKIVGEQSQKSKMRSWS